MNQTIEKYFKDQSKIINRYLEYYLPDEKLYPPIIQKAIRYSVLNGGKRFRPVLMLATSEMLGSKPKDIIPAACAIEMIHCYSLVHDDLPCMDNDDFRRGKPTTHRQYGEAIAILAGNALICLAFEIMSQYALKNKTMLIPYQKAMVEIGQASGFKGMVAGQVADLEAEKKKITKKRLAYIHDHKTGALITTSIRVGGIISDASSKQLNLLAHYGNQLGLMFQITDDILDIESTAEKRGKKIGGDLDHDKATYPKLYGLKKSKSLVTRLLTECHNSLKPFGKKADTLNQIAEFIAYRKA